MHAPEAECISKGKGHKLYQLGGSLVSCDLFQEGVHPAAHALPERSYDGHTLMHSLAQAALNTGIHIRAAVADKGYRGREIWPGSRTVLPEQRSSTLVERRCRRTRLRRHSVIETVIGHIKVDGPVDRNRLKGNADDATHPILRAADHNPASCCGRSQFFCALIYASHWKDSGRPGCPRSIQLAITIRKPPNCPINDGTVPENRFFRHNL